VKKKPKPSEDVVMVTGASDDKGRVRHLRERRIARGAPLIDREEPWRRKARETAVVLGAIGRWDEAPEPRMQRAIERAHAMVMLSSEAGWARLRAALDVVEEHGKRLGADKTGATLDQLLWALAEKTREHVFSELATDEQATERLAAEVRDHGFRAGGRGGQGKKGCAWLLAFLSVRARAFGFVASVGESEARAIRRAKTAIENAVRKRDGVDT
jgi:hypothetical protein